jgi:hypothetical protein
MFRGHKIWEWQYHEDSNRLFHLKGLLMDIYTPSAIPQYANRPNFWTRSRIKVPWEELGDICLVKPVALLVYSVLSTSASPPNPIPPADFWHAIKVWGNSWMWDNLSIRGEVSWLAELIADNSFVAVTNGSYMKEVYPNINSAAFVFVCTKSQGRLWGSYVEHTPDAGSYWGELLGLMAIHLILCGVNESSPNLTGSVHILLDCLGRLNKVKDLPPYRIPAKCSHLDILKNIMANCSNLSFSRIFSHVKAHQDDGRKYGDLLREAQLNCQMDYLAKKAIHKAPPTQDAAT